MGLRPARTCRDLGKQAWARYSKSKPKQSFVKAMPHLSLLVYQMGLKSQNYEVSQSLVAKQDIQLRDNALESARQAANKYLEKILINAYYFRVLVYPHNVIRENKMVAGAGADRIQKGMRKSFGRATDRAARINEGQAIFYIEASKANRPHIIEAYRRARSKLSGAFAIVEKDLMKGGG
jgi:large subunit ribosomal protein L10e